MTRARRSPYTGVFLLVMFGLLALFNAAKPRVMVLHKEHKGDEWAEQVDAGVRRALKSNRRPVSMSWHYLDLDRKASAAAKTAAVNEARRAVSYQDPDILIAVDDESNALVAAHYAGQQRPKVLYVSIDMPPAHYGYTTVSNVSGIAEVLPLAGARDAMRAMRDGRPCRVAAVGADCDTGRAEMAQVKAFNWAPCTLTHTTLSQTWSEFQRSVAKAGETADVLLVLTFEGMTATDGGTVADTVVAPWIEQNARPLVIGLRHEYVAEGGAFALTAAGENQGADAMDMALDWLDRPWISGAPEPVTSDAFNVMMRQSALEKRGVKLPVIYREAARATGHLYP